MFSMIVFIALLSAPKGEQDYYFQSAKADLTSVLALDHFEKERKTGTYLVISDQHTSSERSLMSAATDYIRGLALMNVIHHLVSNGNV